MPANKMAHAQPAMSSEDALLQLPIGGNRRSEAFEARQIDDFSRRLLEVAKLAADSLDNASDRASTLHSLAGAYAFFGEEESSFTLFDQAILEAAEIEDAESRLSELNTYIGVLAAILPVDNIERFIDERLMPFEGVLTAEELVQVRQRAIALIYASSEDYERAVEASLQIGNSAQKEAVQQSIHAVAVQNALRSGDFRQQIALERRSDLSDYTVLSQERTQTPTERLRELYIVLLRGQRHNSSDSIEEEIEEVVEIIQTISSPAIRAGHYAQLGIALSFNGQREQAMEFLDIALDILNSSENEDDSTSGILGYGYGGIGTTWGDGSELLSIGSAFVIVGDIERGIQLIQSVENHPTVAHQKISTLIQVASALSAQELSDNNRDIITGLLAAAEDVLPLVTPEPQRLQAELDIASAYQELGEPEKSQEIFQRFVTLYERGALLEDIDAYYDFLLQWSFVLTELEEFDLAAQIAMDINDIEQLMRIPAGLVSVGRDTAANNLIEELPVESRPEALVSMAIRYEDQGRLELAFSTMTRAISLAQMDDAVRAEEYSNPLGTYPAQTDRIMGWYIDAAGVERAKLLLPYIENQDNRISILTRRFPVEEAYPIIQSMEPSEISDADLFSLSLSLFANGNIYEALAVSSDIQSAKMQANNLIVMAKDHGNAPSMVGSDVNQLLQQIENRYL
ncbi:MAG: hypothetical protein AAGL08_10595 [Cyanobacteria bacterium J06573_11]